MKKVSAEIKKALRHPDVLGAGAKKRKALSPEDRKTAVMLEFDRGTLHSGSGSIVKKRDQAYVIALSEAGQLKKKKKKRRST